MNSVISEYKETLQNPAVEPNNDLGIIVSVIIFVAVAIFVGLYVYNFIKGFKSDDMTANNILKKKNKDGIEEDYKNNYQSMKKMNNQSIICNVCGEENDSDSNFCKNCGNRLQ